MRLLYKPFEIIASMLGAKVGQSTFLKLWARIDGGDPPGPTTSDASLSKVISAAALKAATTAAIAAAFDRASARSFHYLFGYWPGKERESQRGELERGD
jgi:hypothetical protein